MILTLFLVAGICGAIAAAIADSRGASAGLGFIAGALLGPIGVALAFVLERKSAGAAGGTIGAATSEKACPRCAETVKAAALVCRYCGHEFAPIAVAEKSAPVPEATTEYITARNIEDSWIVWVAIIGLLAVAAVVLIGLAAGN